MANSSYKQPHAIMIPLPLQGHIIPCIDFALKLASNGFIITFINTEIVHHQISKIQRPQTIRDNIFAEARKSGLDIRYVTVSDGYPIQFDRSLNKDRFLENFQLVFLANVDELVGKIIETTDFPVTCLIADTIHVSMSTIAKKYNLVHISFWTEAALVLTLCYHSELLKINGHFAGGRKDTIDYIPGVDGIDPTDLMTHIQDKESTVLNQSVFKALEDIKMADFIVCNAVQELENKVISALHQKQPIYAIGPIFPNGFTNKIVGTSLLSESDCTQWLDTKPDGSVLYVSFGSLATCTKNDILEIAHGLSISGVSFVWVLRPNIISSMETDFLPVGFMEDVSGRGLIVPWCNQRTVISHPSIGGFLTHCGWNSILESMWCAVPLLCFPLFSDQITNRKLVVNDWRIGINLCDKKPITSGEVSEKINRLMSGKLADELMNEMKIVKRILENALAIDGSSHKIFNQFVKDLYSKIHEKCGLHRIDC